MKGLGWVQVPRVIRRRRSSKRRCVLRTLKKGLKLSGQTGKFLLAEEKKKRWCWEMTSLVGLWYHRKARQCTYNGVTSQGKGAWSLIDGWNGSLIVRVELLWLGDLAEKLEKVHQSYDLDKNVSWPCAAMRPTWDMTCVWVSLTWKCFFFFFLFLW